MNKKIFISTILLLLAFTARAQLYSDGLITNKGLVSDWQTQYFNTLNGVFDGLDNGIFEHHGPSTSTFVNNGVFNALSGHTDKFMGPLGVVGPQEIGGAVRPYFYNLEFSNGTGQLLSITNTDGANVRKLATFSNGITTTIRANHQVGALRFEDGATYTGGNTDAQHVNGYVSKIGDDIFTFPVGSGTDLRTLSISAPAGAIDQYSVAWIAGDPTTTTDPSGTLALHPVATFDAASLGAVSPVGQWDWIVGANIPAVTAPVPANSPAGTGTGAGLSISVSIPDMTLFATAGNLRLVGWDGTKWINLSTGIKPYATGTSYASGVAEGNTLQGTMVEGITAIGIGSPDKQLPVTLTRFTATKERRTSILSWSTTVETNSESFEIEHRTAATGWSRIGSVKAKGESKNLVDYNFVDGNPTNGENLYRLKMIDQDASFAYSRINSVTFDFAPDLTVYPNPAVNQFKVKITGNTDWNQVRQINLYDLMGRVVYTSRVVFAGEVDVANISAGAYVVSITYKDGTVHNQKIQISK